MQGRIYRGDIPVTLTGTVYGPYTVSTTDVLTNNLHFPMVYGDTYTITTLQPRYLNIPASLAKMITVTSAITISSLELRAGNAIWTDDVINVQDAGKIGAAYGIFDINNDADVNFDGAVNIQDLAIVGGNIYLTSASAYASWVP
jgi:hypothetical protein